MKLYKIEKDGQIDFFKNFHIDYENNSVLIDHTDGVWNGCLFEFKLKIDNPNKVLFQAIKYLSKMRIKGESVPATIILVSLNTQDCYVYNSIDYYEQIHKVYFGGSSINNENFIANDYKYKFDLSRDIDVTQLFHILKDKKEIYEMYIPIEINEDCIVGWAERFYRENPNAKKGDFIGTDEGIVPIKGEIREPKYFKHLIKPYIAQSNQKFKYLMDKLNDKQKKKDLGAFYSPMPYCEMAANLIRKAIEKVPKGNDYIILDRCAGTGNLEAILTDEELSHCILSTYEYYEYKVLFERLSDKVKAIIPPTENNINYSSGYILNANALDKDYINNELIKSYIDNPKYTIIMLENPPYRDITAQDKVDTKEKNYIYNEFIKNGTDQAAHREIANLFIWSAFKYYLRQPTDSYIVFAPVKYFKSLNYLNKKFVEGYAFNRKHFHNSESVVSCVYWQNIEDYTQKEYKLEAFDIVDNKTVYIKDIIIKKTYKTFADYNDKRKFKEDKESLIYCDNNTGFQSQKSVGKKRAIYNDNIVGYLRATSFNLNANSRCLTRTITYDALTQSYGFYLRKDNYINKLPLFAAKLYPQSNWYEKDVYFTTSDGGEQYLNDSELLKKCLIYVSLCSQNRCRSFESIDGKLLKNEICLDKNTCATTDITRFKLDDDDKELINLYQKILSFIREMDLYNNKFTYGTFQVENDFNTYHLDDNGDKIYDYPILNGYLRTLYVKLKDYYEKYIVKNLFKYELLK